MIPLECGYQKLSAAYDILIAKIKWGNGGTGKVKRRRNNDHDGNSWCKGSRNVFNDTSGMWLSKIVCSLLPCKIWIFLLCFSILSIKTECVKESKQMKTIVIYNSQTGFTKRYAEWIAEAAGADCLELSVAKRKICFCFIFFGFQHLYKHFHHKFWRSRHFFIVKSAWAIKYTYFFRQNGKLKKQRYWQILWKMLKYKPTVCR